jgi:hypothetical protein
MTLADREYQRAHRNDKETSERRSSYKIWRWIVAVVVILIVARFFWPPR